MEKTTKKKKKTKGLRRRIGIIAVGGLSLVMTVCLSVGATLAWFAGSTWSDENLYMGGPVYIEMAGRGHSGTTGGTNANEAKWMGGTGSLDIQASAARTSGTAYSVDRTDPNNPVYKDAMGNTLSADAAANIDRNVLLPGQKFEIYSQARVYSTATTSSIADTDKDSASSGANVTNKSGNGMAYHRTNDGRITTTTTSVIRARFSISIEFDPSVGFGNFTNQSYMENYPVQSAPYTGDGEGGSWSDATPSVWTATPKPWKDALTNTAFAVDNNKPVGGANPTPATTTYTGRRDAVKLADSNWTADQTTKAVLEEIKAGTKKSIYSWKYVSEATYKDADLTVQNVTSEAPTKPSIPNNTAAVDQIYAQMGAPFDGSDKSTNSNGYYAVWILTDDADNKTGVAESDAFYKARCNAYLQTYVEEFQSEYGNIETKTIASSILALESSLNQSFVNLVNDASDDIIAGYTQGFTVSATDGTMVPKNSSPSATDKHNASWLYIDPTIGNDTNTDEISTATGGWWYLVASDNAGVKSGKNTILTAADSAYYDTDNSEWTDTKNTVTPLAYKDADGSGNSTVAAATKVEKATADDVADGYKKPDGSKVAVNDTFYKLTPGTQGFTRAQFAATDATRLHAMLYEVKPNAQTLDEVVGKNGTGANSGVKKIVSPAFPFVNGSAALPGDALTNVFANAKISFQISFQAIQAFLPFSTSIDKMDYTNPLLGTAKALTIKNAIPIFNEAFDYQETGITSSTIDGL